jgi:hypothetical protein
MKLYYSALLAVCVLALSCSKSNEEPEVLTGNVFITLPGEGVQEWNEESFIFNRFYSLVDTIGKVDFRPSVAIKYGEGSNVTTSWSVNGKSENATEIHKEWLPDIKLWFIANEPVLSKALTYGDNIKAIVKINSTTYTREGTIRENKILSDVLGVSFGLSKEKVEANERARMEQHTTLYATSWREYKPNTAVMWYSTNIPGGLTIYRFSNDKLVEVGEYITTLEYTESLAKYCSFLGLKETPTITEGKLDKNYIWNNGKMEFKLSIIEDAPTVGNSDLSNALGITYRKL